MEPQTLGMNDPPALQLTNKETVVMIWEKTCSLAQETLGRDRPE